MRIFISIPYSANMKIVIQQYFVQGSFEMKKLREAVMGKKGRNLDDLSHMDGELLFWIIK